MAANHIWPSSCKKTKHWKYCGNDFSPFTIASINLPKLCGWRLATFFMFQFMRPMTREEIHVKLMNPYFTQNNVLAYSSHSSSTNTSIGAFAFDPPILDPILCGIWQQKCWGSYTLHQLYNSRIVSTKIILHLDVTVKPCGKSIWKEVHCFLCFSPFDSPILSKNSNVPLKHLVHGVK